MAGLQEKSRRTGGRLALKPEDFLSVGWAPPAWEPAGTISLPARASAIVASMCERWVSVCG